jgi:hypothetical protein
VWPSEKVKTKVAYAIRIAGHFWIGIVEDDGKQKALFDIGDEGNEACSLIVDYLLTRAPPKGVLSMSSLIGVPKERRGEVIAEELSKPLPKKPTKKTKRKVVKWGPGVRGGGEEEEEEGWTVVGRKKQGRQDEDDRKVQMRVTVAQPLVNAMVVWTKEPETLEREMRHKHPAAAKLVGGVRVKRNHTIIMTTPNESGATTQYGEGTAVARI